MARKYKLQWLESGRRWRKQYKNRQHYFPLLPGETKATSYQRCLQEWQAKKLEVDTEISHVAGGPAEEIVKLFVGLQDSHRRRGDVVRYTASTEVLRLLQTALSKGVDVSVDDDGIPRLPASLGTVEEPAPAVTSAMNQLDQVTKRCITALSPVDSESAAKPWDGQVVIPENRTINGLIEAFLIAHPKAPGYRINRYREWADTMFDASTIEGTHCRAYRNYLEAETRKEEKPISRKYAKDCLAIFKQFLRYLFEDVEILEHLPRNISRLKIDVPTKQVQIIDPAILRKYLVGSDPDLKLLKTAEERLRLIVLLMMNCGMNQIDVAELKQSEVNWTTGRVVRRRSKLENATGNIPTSNYKLWPETFSLLVQQRSDDPTRVIIGSRGQPLVTRSVGGGGRNDSVRLAFMRFRKRLGLNSELPLKHIRKTSASIIADKNSEDLATLFLGDAPTSTAGKHYIAVSDSRLDECLSALRDHYQIGDVLEPDGSVI